MTCAPPWKRCFHSWACRLRTLRRPRTVLVYADLRGIESHGVSNLMRNYVKGFSEGAINPRPEVRVVREAAAVATLDSDRGHGLVVGPFAMKMAIEKARTAGIGAVVVGNGRHFGAAAYHAQMALEHDMVGIAMTVGGTAMAPTGGAKALVGLNPLSIAAPDAARGAVYFRRFDEHGRGEQNPAGEPAWRIACAGLGSQT